ncbi:Arabinanase/levansucrase/invertase [Phialemonium atrogriseum]|uniref:Arabinanase/levansucrase/invertase n=1 Tax=Phialemonium atrogriseum TaxID=1093897 RepID=A0AAJ0BQH8_9PEZI|nr:Arabinanase/levansucrase/invertase [Phialemonium atrogriseum]KAK1762605.1 Arabinanase/levansucrase/invertase [Phialemonium atrogriseum]
MAFNRFRPTGHFIAPHSWSNDPCGAVYVPETKEYLVCYQWNPGTSDGGNCAWGMARSKDLVIWEDCAPAIRNGPSYDSLGVFSGSIVSRLIDGERVLFLFYTSVSALPIHWSKPYIWGCESQSVAVSTDFGRSWHRSHDNPLLSMPPKGEATTGWRDPFVSQWSSLSTLLGVGQETSYMMIASGERGRGPQLHLYKSHDLCNWDYLSVLLDVKRGSKISKNSRLRFGNNFECASFFSAGQMNYILLGVEEDEDSLRHNYHYTLWLSGTLRLEDGKPRFDISGHGLADHGISYAPHIFRDSKDRLIQLGWADEAAKKHVVKGQGWAGCLAHPRELFEVSKPIVPGTAMDAPEWTLHKSSGRMTTLGIRPAPQVAHLRRQSSLSSLKAFVGIRATTCEVEATFFNLSGTEKFVFNVFESPGSVEVTKLVFDLGNGRITVDRSQSSLSKLGADTPDSGCFRLLPGEDLSVKFFLDVSLVEIYANDRFALTSRVYPSLDTSRFASYDLGAFDERNVQFECWEDLKVAWPARRSGRGVLEEPRSIADLKSQGERIHVKTLTMHTVDSVE